MIHWGILFPLIRRWLKVEGVRCWLASHDIPILANIVFIIAFANWTPLAFFIHLFIYLFILFIYLFFYIYHSGTCDAHDCQWPALTFVPLLTSFILKICRKKRSEWSKKYSWIDEQAFVINIVRQGMFWQGQKAHTRTYLTKQAICNCKLSYKETIPDAPQASCRSRQKNTIWFNPP